MLLGSIIVLGVLLALYIFRPNEDEVLGKLIMMEMTPKERMVMMTSTVKEDKDKVINAAIDRLEKKGKIRRGKK